MPPGQEIAAEIASPQCFDHALAYAELFFPRHAQWRQFWPALQGVEMSFLDP
jgi:hypothetical protein